MSVSACAQNNNDSEGGAPMGIYERPTLTLAGSFKKMTGLGCSGPRDTVFNKQCI